MGSSFDPTAPIRSDSDRLILLKQQRDEIELELATRPTEYWVRNRRVQIDLIERLRYIEETIAKLEGKVQGQGCVARNSVRMVVRTPRRLQ